MSPSFFHPFKKTLGIALSYYQETQWLSFLIIDKTKDCTGLLHSFIVLNPVPNKIEYMNHSEKLKDQLFLLVKNNE